MASDITLVTLVDATDPTGHSQPCKEIVYDVDGTPVHSGVYVIVHGGQRLIFIYGNPSPSNLVTTVYEENPAGTAAMALPVGKVAFRAT